MACVWFFKKVSVSLSVSLHMSAVYKKEKDFAATQREKKINKNADKKKHKKNADIKRWFDIENEVVNRERE